MVQTRRTVTSPSDRLQTLLAGAVAALEDGCPPDPRRQVCRYQSDYDEGACTRCWHQYYLDIVNGRCDFARQRDRFGRDAESIYGR